MTIQKSAAISASEDAVEQTVELFCGERQAFSQIARALGYSTFTVDANSAFAPNAVADIRSLDISVLPEAPLIVWAAPPDAGFGNSHWTGIDPVDQAGEMAMELFSATVNALSAIRPKWWFIENPKGPLRNLPIVAGFNRGYPTRNRRTVRSDEYGGNSSKEIDVWTNAYWWIPSPGERSGAGGVDTGRRVPPLVFSEILGQLEQYRTTGSYGPR